MTRVKVQDLTQMLHSHPNAFACIERAKARTLSPYFAQCHCWIRHVHMHLTIAVARSHHSQCGHHTWDAAAITAKHACMPAHAPHASCATLHMANVNDTGFCLRVHAHSGGPQAALHGPFYTGDLGLCRQRRLTAVWQRIRALQVHRTIRRSTKYC